MDWNKINWDVITDFNDEHDENEDIDWVGLWKDVLSKTNLPTNEKSKYLLREKSENGELHYWIGMYENDFTMPYFYDPEMVNDSEIIDNAFFPDAWIEITE